MSHSKQNFWQLWQIAPFHHFPQSHMLDLIQMADTWDPLKNTTKDVIYVMDISALHATNKSLIITQSGHTYVSILSSHSFLSANSPLGRFDYHYTGWDQLIKAKTSPFLSMLPHINRHGVFLQIHQNQPERSDWLNLSLCQSIDTQVIDSGQRVVILSFAFPLNQSTCRFSFQFKHALPIIYKQLQFAFHLCYAWCYYRHLKLLNLQKDSTGGFIDNQIDLFDEMNAINYQIFEIWLEPLPKDFVNTPHYFISTYLDFFMSLPIPDPPTKEGPYIKGALKHFARKEDLISERFNLYK